MKNTPYTRHLKLPFQFDELKLIQDLELVLENHWVPHHYTANYEGAWNSIALYTPKNDEKSITAFSNTFEKLQESPLLKKCEYLKEVINHFKCPLLAVRLLRLEPNAKIKKHKDYKLGYEHDNFRLHIPIITNDAVEFMLDDELLDMRPGECWYTNVNFFHSVANNGVSDRVHLVIDGERNAWSDELFFSLAPKESLISKIELNNKEETWKGMLENLKEMEGPAVNEMREELLKKLQSIK